MTPTMLVLPFIFFSCLSIGFIDGTRNKIIGALLLTIGFLIGFACGVIGANAQ